jgi:hypothetical protein
MTLVTLRWFHPVREYVTTVRYLRSLGTYLRDYVSVSPRWFPIPVRNVLRIIGVNDFEQLSTSRAAGVYVASDRGLHV